MKQEAESEVKVTKDKAWRTARDINDSAEKFAELTINNAKNFISIVLNKISKIPGGKAIVNWAKPFMVSYTKPKNQPSETVKNDKSQGKSI